MNALPTVSVWSKAPVGQTGWEKVGEVRTWTRLVCEPRHLAVGPWSLTMPYDQQAQSLLVDRAVTVDFRGERIMTGLVDTFLPRSDENGQPVLEVIGVDAMALMGDVTCWPKPSAALSAQTDAYYTASGTAETVLRSLALANMVTRLGQDITFPASAGHGLPINLSVRFDNLLEAVAAKCLIAGLGVRVGLVDTSGTRAQMTVSFFAPEDKTQRVRLSHSVGTLRTWQQSTQVPAVTRAIIGGGGEGVARVFRSVANASAESQWRRVREVFIDARDTSDTVTLDERGAEAIAEGAGQSSFTLEAAEAEGMRYVTHYGVGDKVTVELLTGIATADHIGAVRLECAENGVKVTPVVGNPDGGDPQFALGTVIAGLRQQIRRLEQRR